MTRRDLLKFFLVTSAAEFIDYEKLLWIPNEKKIFILNKPILNETQILAMELEKLIPGLSQLFERDNAFYEPIRNARVGGYDHLLLNKARQHSTRSRVLTQSIA
jgi:hypothetical protein